MKVKGDVVAAHVSAIQLVLGPALNRRVGDEHVVLFRSNSKDTRMHFTRPRSIVRITLAIFLGLIFGVCGAGSGALSGGRAHLAPRSRPVIRD